MKKKKKDKEVSNFKFHAKLLVSLSSPGYSINHSGQELLSQLMTEIIHRWTRDTQTIMQVQKKLKMTEELTLKAIEIKYPKHILEKANEHFKKTLDSKKKLN